ncbi:MAG: PQQ-binding-like beta-propeller repeat protein [Pyrinomonadaceae bacterium]
MEAADLFSGATVWRSERMRGQLMQMAIDPDADLIAVVFARDARGGAGETFKRRPEVRALRLSTGAELWKHELDGEVEMMPERWTAGDEVPYTFDNYHPPLFLDDRLYLFYEGVTSFDARTGESRERVRFRVNEEGLALTEADPVMDERHIYFSGRGRVRAVSRDNGKVVWEATDLGVTPEMMLEGRVLFVRTGGRFTRLKDGEAVERGPYGVSAIDAQTGKVLWRYKGADKGITNLALLGAGTLLIADADDLLIIDVDTGKRRYKIEHDLEQAAFVIINERGEAVAGGQNEIAAFDVEGKRAIWRARHTPPGRGALRTVGAIAARAAALYFSYGWAATTALRGVRLASAASSLRWSGLAARSALPNLTTLASSASVYARQGVSARFRAYGIAARVVQRGELPAVRMPRPSIDIQDRALDLIDPARQLERLSRLLLRRERLAALRGDWMYFYTSLPAGGKGLAGVSVNTGQTERSVRIEELDRRFAIDESARLLFTARGKRLLAYDVR